MTISYSINKEAGLVHSRLTGDIDRNDIHAFFKELRNNKAFQPGSCALHDGRNINNMGVDYNSIHALANDCPWGKGSYRAIVISRPLMFGLSRMYQSLLTENRGTIQIFDDLKEAEIWMDSVVEHKSHGQAYPL